MTRREEIEQQAEIFRQPYRGSGNYSTSMDIKNAFQEGAKWADKTMIEKARQWFNLHFRQVCTPRKIKHDFESKEKMWKSFIQFMEE